MAEYPRAMPMIEVSEEILKALRARVRDFNETPDSVIGRLLGDEQRPSKATASVPTGEIDPSLVTLVRSGRFQHANGKDRYLALLKALHDLDPDKFSKKVPGLKFGKRIQIAGTREEIEMSGKSTLPQEIEGTNFWALTNLSNRSKRDVIFALMQRLEFPERAIRFALQTIPDSAAGRSSTELLSSL